MKSKIIPDHEVFSKCAWCNENIHEDSPVYGFGVKYRSGVNLTEFEGKAIELSIVTQNKNVPMLITIEGSDAKKDGNDAMFMACSLECGNKLRNILLKEKSIGDMFEEINSLNN